MWRSALLEALPFMVLGLLWGKLLVLEGALEVGYTEYPAQRRAGTATLALLLLLASPLALLGRTTRMAGALTIAAGASLLALIDLLHIAYFGDVVTLADLSRAAQLPAVRSSVIDLLRPMHALLFADLLLVAALLPVYVRWCRSTPAVSSKSRRRTAAGLLITSMLTALVPAHLVARDEEALFDYAYTRRQVALALGLLPYHLYDVVVLVSHPLLGRLGVTDDEREAVLRYLVRRRSNLPPPSPLHGTVRGANVILVMVESLQDFPLGLHLLGRPVTPHLNALAGESLRFVNFFDQTHLGNTSDGELASLQSLHPLPSGAVATRFGTNDYHGLPALLASRGYETVSVAGQPAEYWNMQGMHERLGFERSEFAEGFLDDRETFTRAASIMEDLPRPFLMYLITFSSHHPFVQPQPERERFPVGSLDGTLLGRYVQSIHRADAALGEFLTELRSKGILNGSVLVVYGDHRARLEDQPGFPRLVGVDDGDDLGLWLEGRRLPLLIRLPNGEHAGNRRIAGGHLDISLTILGLLGLTPTETVMLGDNLLAAESNLVVFRDGSFTDGRRHFLRRFGPVDASLARDERTDRPLHPGQLERERQEAARELRVSDLIIAGNLLPWLRDTLPSTAQFHNRGRRPNESDKTSVLSYSFGSD
jgi:phosphoglycerol transferase MdoB-like AlkP superfamily enzyme